MNKDLKSFFFWENHFLTFSPLGGCYKFDWAKEFGIQRNISPKPTIYVIHYVIRSSRNFYGARVWVRIEVYCFFFFFLMTITKYLRFERENHKNLILHLFYKLRLIFLVPLLSKNAKWTSASFETWI